MGIVRNSDWCERIDIYEYRCCLTGIEVPEVLRASHIIPWSGSKNTCLNPENGLCLSASYDAAFDKHLITFDEDYRLVLIPVIKKDTYPKRFGLISCITKASG